MEIGKNYTIELDIAGRYKKFTGKCLSNKDEEGKYLFLDKYGEYIKINSSNIITEVEKE